MRIYLTGAVQIVANGVLIGQETLPGPQGRLVFALLALEHCRPVSRDEIAIELWGDSPPRAWETSIRALISKLRGLLEAAAGVRRQAIIQAALSCYQLQLPRDAWLDVEAAAAALHVAEAALAAGDTACAGSNALVASSIGRRPFLPGFDGPWVGRQRERLQQVRLRALECLGSVWLRKGDYALATGDAERALQLDPFRESAYRLLMRAHAAAGNRASAVQAYQRCRRVLAAELGVRPGPETEETLRQILQTR